MEILTSSLLKFIIGIASATANIKLHNTFSPNEAKQLSEAFEKAIDDYCPNNQFLRNRIRQRLNRKRLVLISAIEGNEIELNDEEKSFLEYYMFRIMQTDAWEKIKGKYLVETNDKLEIIDSKLAEFIGTAFPALNNKINEIIKVQSETTSVIIDSNSVINEVRSVIPIHGKENDVFKEYKTLIDGYCHLLSSDIENNSNDEYKLQIKVSPNNKPVDEMLNDFFVNEEQVLFLLGGIGSGKSTSLSNFINKLIKSRTEENTNDIIPFFIQLKDYDYDSHESISEYIIKKLQYNSSLSLNNYVLKQLLCSKKSILILDGLDEIKNLSNIEKIKKTLIDIISEFNNSNKIIISFRSTLVPNDKELFNDLHRQFREKDFSDYNLKKLELSEINKILIHENHNVTFNSAILTSPILLKMLRAIISSNRKKNINISSKENLIEECIRSLMDHKKNLKYTHESSAFWWNFILECSFQMYKDQNDEISPKKIDDILKKLNPSSSPGLDQLKSDATVRTVFDVNEYGLSFSHRIFKEFLIGAKLSNMILNPSDNHFNFDENIITIQTLESVQYFCRDSKFRMSNLRKNILPPSPDKYGIIWQYIPAGLSISRDSNGLTKLFYIKESYWISDSLISVGQYLKASIDKTETVDFMNLVNKDDTNDNNALNNVTIEKANRIAKELFNGEIPSENQWIRACCGYDCSHPLKSALPLYEIEDSKTFVPEIRQGLPNVFGIFDASGCLWQWIKERKCKGPHWARPINQQLSSWSTLNPSQDWHNHTGFRVVKNT